MPADGSPTCKSQALPMLRSSLHPLARAHQRGGTAVGGEAVESTLGEPIIQSMWIRLRFAPLASSSAGVSPLP